MTLATHPELPGKSSFEQHLKLSTVRNVGLEISQQLKTHVEPHPVALVWAWHSAVHFAVAKSMYMHQYVSLLHALMIMVLVCVMYALVVHCQNNAIDGFPGFLLFTTLPDQVILA